MEEQPCLFIGESSQGSRTQNFRRVPSVTMRRTSRLPSARENRGAVSRRNPYNPPHPIEIMRQDERALERIYAWRRVREEVDPGRRIYKRIRQPKIIRKLDIIPEDEEVRLFECVFEPTTPQQLIQRPPLGSYGAYQQDHQAAAVHNSGGSLYTAAAPTARVDLYPARTPEHCSYIPEIPHLPTPGPQERPTFIERHLAFGYILPSRSRFTRRGKEKKGEKSMRSERVSSFFGRGVLGFSSGMKGDKGKRKGKEKADDDRCEGDRGSDGSDRTPRGSDDGSSSASNRT